MSLFEEKNIAPMLIGADGGAFDDMDYLFEIKWDGERCIAYCHAEGSAISGVQIVWCDR